MAAVDDSVANLQKFCGEAEGATSHLTHSNVQLQEVAEAIEQLGQRAQSGIADLNEALQEGLQALGDGREAVVTALDGVASEAEESVSDTLDAKESELEDAVRETEDAAETARDDLEQACDRVTDDGFRLHLEALSNLDSGLTDAEHDGQEAFLSLAGEIQALEARGAALRDEAGNALAEAESEAEQEASGLGERFDSAKTEWAQTIDEGVRESCEEVGVQVQQLYADWGDAVGGVADEIGEECAAPLEQAATFLEQESHQALEQAVGLLLRDPSDALLAEQGEAASVLEAGSAVAEALLELVPDLRVSVSVVGEIDRLLNELG